MHVITKTALRCGTLALLVVTATCSDDDPTGPSASLQCAAGNAGITLPPGFCAVLVADLTVGGQPAKARHMVVTPNGDVFVAINSPQNVQPAFGIIGLRDADGDGDAEEQTQFSPNLGGSGLAWGDGSLYFGANDQVLRFTLPSGQLTPTGNPTVVVAGLPSTGDHISKTVALSGQTLYVNVGSASNSCQLLNRVLLSPGVFPCPELPTRAGVWKFTASGTNQTQSLASRYATGLRNMVALAVHPGSGDLYGAQHGRDDLFENWPALYTAAQSAVVPSEEVVRIAENSDNGWPYCYFDAETQNKKVLAPEYGGDGGVAVTGPQGVNCATYNQPIANLDAHWAPNGMTFYTGGQFPSKYENGLFVAMHGGHDRAPLPNEGYNVMFIPMNSSGTPTGAPEIFADGFAGGGTPLPANAVHRPVGVTQGPDGSLYISDDKGGRIWRVIYRP